jgi:hypothetical protein
MLVLGRTWRGDAAACNASLYDIKAFFCGFTTQKNGSPKLNSKSTDDHYNMLMDALKHALSLLARQIEEKVYTYGFLRR